MVSFAAGIVYSAEMTRVFFGIVAVLFLINGISILGADDCSSVSFDGQGGSRAMSVVCYPDSTGALPASLAGVGMILIAIVGAVYVFRPRS